MAQVVCEENSYSDSGVRLAHVQKQGFSFVKIAPNSTPHTGLAFLHTGSVRISYAVLKIPQI